MKSQRMSPRSGWGWRGITFDADIPTRSGPSAGDPSTIPHRGSSAGRALCQAERLRNTGPSPHDLRRAGPFTLVPMWVWGASSPMGRFVGGNGGHQPPGNCDKSLGEDATTLRCDRSLRMGTSPSDRPSVPMCWRARSWLLLGSWRARSVGIGKALFEWRVRGDESCVRRSVPVETGFANPGDSRSCWLFLCWPSRAFPV